MIRIGNKAQMKRKKIAVITGTRAEYGLLRGIMKRIRKSQSLDLQVIVTGTHVSKDFGHTLDEIVADGFKVDSKVRILSADDSGFGMAMSLGIAVRKISRSLAKMHPSILVMLGDRLEVLAAALASTYMNVPIAHIHGGDVSGSVDQSVRYAISKLSHIHFVATTGAAARLKAIGEDRKRIFVVGAPGLDEIVERSYTAADVLEKKYGVDVKRPLVILLQHPVVTEEKQAAWQITQTLKALEDLRIQSIIIYPNVDSGGRSMIRTVKQQCRRYGFLKSMPSIPRSDFLGLMSIADVMIGNSSSAIIESSLFKLPVINIGTRQVGRERAGNVIDVDHDRQTIKYAIKKALEDKQFLHKVRTAKNPYGGGRSSEAITRILQQVNLDEIWPKR